MKKKAIINVNTGIENEEKKSDPLELDSNKIKPITEDELVDENTSESSKEKKKDEYPPVSFFKLFRYSTGWEIFWLIIGILCSLGTGCVSPLNIIYFGDLTTAMVTYGFIVNNLTLESIPHIPPETQSFYFIPESHVESFLIQPFHWTTTKTPLESPYPLLTIPQPVTDNLLDAVFNFAIQNTCLGIGLFVLTYISNNLFNWIAESQIKRIRKLYFRSVLSQDISWYDMNHTGDLASRMADDVSKLEDGIGEKVSMFIYFISSFIGLLIMALTKGWKLALVCLSSFPVIIISIGIVSLITSRYARNELESYGLAGSIAEECLSSIRTVFSFNGQEKESERYKKNLIHAYKNNLKRHFFGGLGFGLLWFFIYASYALAFWYGVTLVLEERDVPDNEKIYTPGTMVSVFFGVMMGSMFFGMTSPLLEAFSIAKGAAAKIFFIIERISNINPLLEIGEKPESIRGDISFNNVHFTYPSRTEVKILNGLNLTIKRGETLALVGSSGCGKSTCVQLIQRFYDPQEGTIELDGCDVRNLNVAWLRAQIGVVGQEPILFQMSIEDNIRFGKDGCSQEDIIHAAKAANAHDFIMKLPKGYNTMVGERGTQLSGGQKQRIAIARALVRDPSILLLDEATSALDTNSEAKVQQALDKASIGRTTIIVAHRLSTIRNADRIVVFENGRISEEGNHETLMKIPNGVYKDLVNAQTLHIENNTLSPNLGRPEALVYRKQSQVSANSEKEDMEEIPVIDDSLDQKQDDDDDDETSIKFNFFTLLKRNSPEWHYITIGCLASIIIGCSMPVFALLFGNILGVLSIGSESEVRSQTDNLSILFVVAGVVLAISTLLQIYTFGVAGEGLTLRLRGEAFDAMIRQDISWFDDYRNGVGSLCARLSGDASAVQGATGQRVGIIFQSIATLGLGIGIAMYYTWKLGLVAMSFLPVMFWAMYAQASTQKENKKVGSQSNVERSTKVAVEAVSNIRTVASLNRENTFLEKYSEELKKKKMKKFCDVQMRGLVFSLSRSIMFWTYAVCMWYGGQLIVYENLPYEDVFKTSQALIMSTMSLANAMSFAPNFQKGWEAAKKILKLLATESKVKDLPNAADKEHWEKGDVSYNDIEFAYPTRPGIKVLRGLNLKAIDGKTVALVGSSGCGKSTCIQLLERFYDPLSGKITLDQKDISTVKQRNLRYQLGLVSQEPILFARTIKENIQYGDNEREVTMEEVIEVAKKSNIHNFIVKLPLGYDTLMGEKGTQLSGGQKQRVAIARALVRKPKVLLLDEATSALDAESEKVVQEALDKAKEGRTCITIAHRLSTIQDADIIYVLDKGVVKESGTHSQLVARHGLYYRLVKLQT